MTFPEQSHVRLEIQEDGATNQVKNPDGALGGWGWITPTPGTVVERDSGGLGLRVTRAGSDDPWDVFTEPYPIAAGQYTRARFTLTSGFPTSSQYYYFAFDWLDAAGAVISSSTAQGAVAGAYPSTPISATRQAPAGIVAARFKIKAPGYAVPSTWTDVRAIVTDTSAAASTTALNAASEPTWRNITAPTTEIRITREDLSLGVLTATVRDATLDPAFDSLIRPGKRVRVMVNDGTTWQTLYTGTLDEGSTIYRPGADPRARVIITLTASDAMSDLAAATRPQGVATIADLPAVLEGCGVPWLVNGSSAQVPTATPVSSNAAAKASDQIAITRDSVRGYAWVDRTGVLNAVDPGPLPLAGTLDETGYGPDPDIGFGLSTCINEVTVNLRRANASTGQTVEVKYGPYRDQASVNRFGRWAAEFTVHGLADDENTIRAYAAAVLAANGTPIRQFNRVTVPIRSVADITTAKALVDLNAAIYLSSTDAGLGQIQNVTSIEHSIKPGAWTATLGFRRASSVAVPQETPPVQNIAPATAGSGPATVPVSAIQFLASPDVPFGWLLCDGSAVSRTTYAALFAKIGTTHGAGNGTTTFNLPDLRQRFPVGVGPDRALGANDGLTVPNRTPQHVHGKGDLATSATTATQNRQNGTNVAVPSLTHTHEITGSTAGAGGWGQTPTLALTPVIKF